MITGLGCDVVAVKRISALLKKCGDDFVEKICTEEEKKYINGQNKNQAKQIAKIWAVKEAAVKALGVGFAKGIRFKDIELIHNENGKPMVEFYGKAFEILHNQTKKDDINVLVSISDDDGYAQAVVIIEKCSC